MARAGNPAVAVFGSSCATFRQLWLVSAVDGDGEFEIGTVGRERCVRVKGMEDVRGFQVACGL